MDIEYKYRIMLIKAMMEEEDLWFFGEDAVIEAQNIIDEGLKEKEE